MENIEVLDASCSEDSLLKSPKAISTSVVDDVWAALYVGYDLILGGSKVFVAYYDANRTLTMAWKERKEQTWGKLHLPSILTWDSHNSINMGIDAEGYIHLSANMHVKPLVYFRSGKPYDSSSMQQLHHMTGKGEEKVTYPCFFSGNNGELYFSYRGGTCGNGDTFINQYDTTTRTWARVGKGPLLRGRAEKKSAYHQAFFDSDNTFHLLWMWRTNPLVSTCHRLCYARTPDMQMWFNGRGEEVFPPFDPDSDGVVVDDVPEGGGLHNSRFEVIADSNGTPLIIYTKFDSDGYSQVFLAKHVDGVWLTKQISDFEHVWEFQGGGDTMKAGVSFQILKMADDTLTVSLCCDGNEEKIVLVNTKTLEHQISSLPHDHTCNILSYKTSVSKALPGHENVFVNLKAPHFHEEETSGLFALKWLSRGKSHGKRAPEVMPDGPLSRLELLELKRPTPT